MKNQITVESKEYKNAIKVIKDRVYKAQYESLKAVNTELVKLYWDIGEMIVEKQAKLDWGDSVVEMIGKDLQKEFPGAKGFSRRNLMNMKKFFKTYRAYIIVQPLVAQLGWTHNLIIFESCKTSLEREFYIRLTIKERLSKRSLQHKIKNKEYEKWATTQNNFEETLPVEISTEAKVAFKDDYNLDLLLLQDKHTEKQLENAITQNIKIFLNEMGGDFAFIGSQYPIQIDTKEYFIDLLFYQRNLNSLIAIELKIGEYKPEYLGKMTSYLAGLDKFKKKSHENTSIGIIICQTKNRELVNLTLQYVAKPIGVATYTHYNNQKDLPREIQKYLPSKQVLQKKLLSMDTDSTE